jgi:hypothetical protein
MIILQPGGKKGWFKLCLRLNVKLNDPQKQKQKDNVGDADGNRKTQQQNEPLPLFPGKHLPAMVKNFSHGDENVCRKQTFRNSNETFVLALKRKRFADGCLVRDELLQSQAEPMKQASTVWKKNQALFGNATIDLIACSSSDIFWMVCLIMVWNLQCHLLSALLRRWQKRECSRS